MLIFGELHHGIEKYIKEANINYKKIFANFDEDVCFCESKGIQTSVSLSTLYVMNMTLFGPLCVNPMVHLTGNRMSS